MTKERAIIGLRDAVKKKFLSAMCPSGGILAEIAFLTRLPPFPRYACSFRTT